MFLCIATSLAYLLLPWIILSLLWKLLSIILTLLGLDFAAKLCEGPQKTEIGGEKVLLAAQIHQATTLPQLDRSWFSVRDILTRLSLGLIGFWYGMISHPFLFVKYSYIYNRVFLGYRKAVFSVLFLPLWPLFMLIHALYNRNLAYLPMLNVEDEELESLRFFTNKLSPLESFLYDLSQEFCNYVGNFYILGANELAIQTMYWDTDKTTKVFWREKLEAGGARVARELGVWDGKEAKLADGAAECPSILIKITNSCMGVGDKFLKRGQHYSSSEDLISILTTGYLDKPSLLLEVIRPLPELGVHSLDILTARTPSGEVQLVDIVVWQGSTSETSHGATAAYMVDPRTEVACNFGKWYNPNFAETGPAGLGVKYPGVGEAVVTALRTHKLLPYDWLNVVGWDCMVTEDGKMVFFEGNLAAWRCPRRLFIHWRSFVYFLRYISWVGNANF